MEYYDIYRRRLNRYGLDYQSRIQGQRERNFDDYLLKSIYRVDFWFNDIFVPASLERYKQDYTETQCYLLTSREVNIPNGTVLQIESKNGETKPWMVWWVEQIESSGYNKYVVLKMTHLLTWYDANKNFYEQWAYFSGPGTSKVVDSIKSPSGDALYAQDDNLSMFITPYNVGLVQDLYLEIPYKDQKTSYVISGIDINSTPGVSYVTVDPSYSRGGLLQDKNATTATDYWYNGGEA